ncbi:sulfotransferase family protein [Celeribacter halophilus]|uniref:sulfotransferase family protein n=1 Tax=Celeribacter halophilus TaxID=576117 RepID=UPI003A8D0D6F
MLITEKKVILLVGAGRSGTNFIAHALAEHPDITNGYENRFIWNIGQRDKRHDWRDPAEATPATCNRIQRALAAVARESGTLIDKTPGNGLRLEFVRAVLPNAKVVNVIRDGRASLASRMRMWDNSNSNTVKTVQNGRLAKEWDHACEMIRRGNLPWERLPAFIADSSRIMFNTARGQPRLAGERIPGLSEIARVFGLDIARAIQWRDTVTAAVTTGRAMGNSIYHEFRYEDLVHEPAEVASRLADFLELDTPRNLITTLSQNADPARANTWRSDIPPERLTLLNSVLRPTLDWLGYE